MFRSRRSGPPPFQVMSNSWRGPRHEPAKPLPHPKDEEPQTPVAKPAEQPAKRAANPEARRKRDTVNRPAPKRNERAAAAWQAVSSGVGWLGGVTITAANYLGEQAKPLVKRIKPWLTRGKDGQLPRPTVLVGFTGLVIVIMAIIWMNRDGSIETPTLNQPSLGVGDANLDALHRVEPLPGTAGPAANTQTKAASRGTPDTRQSTNPPVSPDAQPKPKLARLALDPREKGKRYFTLATYSVNKEEYLMPLLEYLWSQGVEAAAINSHNSGFFQVIALQGFTREEINQKAHKQYEDTLRRIGRKWKAEGGGDDNLQGLYLQEYSGTQAKLSITKAN